MKLCNPTLIPLRYSGISTSDQNFPEFEASKFHVRLVCLQLLTRAVAAHVLLVLLQQHVFGIGSTDGQTV
jgi:hypothetical protein